MSSHGRSPAIARRCCLLVSCWDASWWISKNSRNKEWYTARIDEALHDNCPVLQYFRITSPTPFFPLSTYFSNCTSHSPYIYIYIYISHSHIGVCRVLYIYIYILHSRIGVCQPHLPFYIPLHPGHPTNRKPKNRTSLKSKYNYNPKMKIYSILILWIGLFAFFNYNNIPPTRRGHGHPSRSPSSPWYLSASQ